MDFFFVSEVTKCYNFLIKKHMREVNIPLIEPASSYKSGGDRIRAKAQRGGTVTSLAELAREKGILEFREFGDGVAKATAMDKLKNTGASKDQRQSVL